MPAPPLFARPSSAPSSPQPGPHPRLRPSASKHTKPNRPLLSPVKRRPELFAVVRSKNKDDASFTDRILDYIEGGPKLRKWYGAPDLLPKDGGAEGEEEQSLDVEDPRDAVLVTNGDSEIGQMVILSLILKRARIKALVKDKRSTEEAFGTYVECMVGNIEDKSFTKKALRGVRSVICPTDDGFFSDPIDLRAVQHIVLLSQLSVYRNSGGLQAIMNSKLRKLAERDEEVVLASGIPSTIIRSASLQTTPGGERGFSFTEGIAAKGRISKEDAATICVEALDAIPQTTLIFEVNKWRLFEREDTWLRGRWHLEPSIMRLCILSEYRGGCAPEAQTYRRSMDRIPGRSARAMYEDVVQNLLVITQIMEDIHLHLESQCVEIPSLNIRLGKNLNARLPRETDEIKKA